MLMLSINQKEIFPIKDNFYYEKRLHENQSVNDFNANKHLWEEKHETYEFVYSQIQI